MRHHLGSTEVRLRQLVLDGVLGKLYYHALMNRGELDTYPKAMKSYLKYLEMVHPHIFFEL